MEPEIDPNQCLKHIPDRSSKNVNKVPKHDPYKFNHVNFAFWFIDQIERANFTKMLRRSPNKHQHMFKNDSQNEFECSPK